MPQQAAAPALVVVGFLMITQISQIPWDDWSIAIPGYLAIALMPFTYSITDGIGAALLFVAYFALSPIEQWLGVR